MIPFFISIFFFLFLSHPVLFYNEQRAHIYKDVLMPFIFYGTTNSYFCLVSQNSFSISNVTMGYISLIFIITNINIKTYKRGEGNVIGMTNIKFKLLTIILLPFSALFIWSDLLQNHLLISEFILTFSNSSSSPHSVLLNSLFHLQAGKFTSRSTFLSTEK